MIPKLKLLSFFALSLLFLVRLSSSKTTCTSVKSFSNLLVSTNEQQRFSLLDYFSGPNLQFQINATTNYKDYTLTEAATPGSQHANIFPPFQTAKVYKQTQSFGNLMGLLITSAIPNQILLYSTPTITSQMQQLSTTITIPSNLTCTDFEFINDQYILVDCYNASSNQYTIQIYSTQFGKLQISKNFPKLINGTGNVRTLTKMQTSTNNFIVFILNQFTDKDSFIETMRVTLNNQVMIHTLPPINKQFFDITSNFTIISMTQASNYIILAANQNSLYKLTLNFTYVDFTLPYQYAKLDSTLTLLNIQSQYVNNILSVFYAYNANNQNSIKQIDWTNAFPIPVSNYKVDLQMKSIQMQVTQDFLLTYITNGDTTNFRSQIVVYQKGTIDFQAWLEQDMPIVYQNQPIGTNFVIQTSYSSNELLILSNSNSQLLNYQQVIQFQLPTIMLAVRGLQLPDSISVQIQCMGNYIALNSTLTSNQELVFTSQSSNTINFKPFAMNFPQIQQLVSTIPCQLLYSEYPGASSVKIPSYFIGSDLSYSIQIASNSSLWKEPKYSFKNMNLVYSSSNYVFPLPDAYKASNINLVETIADQSGFSSWLIQVTDNKVSSLYLLMENLNFDEPVFFYDRTIFSQINGQIISLQWISPQTFIYVTSASPCTLNMYSLGQAIDNQFSEQICENQLNNSIQTLTYRENQVFIALLSYIQIINLQNSTHNQLDFRRSILHSQILTLTSFSNYASYAQGTFLPTKILRDWNRKSIIYIQTSLYTLVADYQAQYIYAQLKPSSNSTNYVICVTSNSLVFVQSGYFEYSITNLTNIVQTKSDLPLYYDTLHQFSVSYALIKSSKKFVYLMDQNSLLTIQTGVPMFQTIKKQVQIGAAFSNGQFLLINNFNQYSESVTVMSSSNEFGIYNNFYSPILTISGFVNGTTEMIQEKPQNNFWFNVQVSSASQPTQTTSMIIPYQIQMNYNKQIQIQLNSSSQNKIKNIIDIPYTHNQEDPISFPFDNKLFTGIVKNYYIECKQCNDTIIMQNAFGMNYLLSDSQDILSVATSNKNYSFVQSFNRIYRIGNQQNKIYDYAQLPFAVNTHYCSYIAVDQNEQYTISACTNLKKWRFYITSFISSEPHVVGYFDAPMITKVNKMILIDQLLFIVDGSIPLIDQFNGIHIFSISFNNEMVLQTQDLSNSWIQYLTTFAQEGITVQPIISFDVLRTRTASTYKFFAATPSGTLYYNNIFYTYPSSINYNDWSSYNLIPSIANLDPDLQSVQNIAQNTELAGVKILDFNYTASAEFSSYQMIVVFKAWHSYDIVLNLQPQRTQPVISIKSRLNRYAFYENQGNVQATIDPSGFIIFSTFLPNYLQGQNYSQHVIIAYDRTNSSGTQLTQMAGNAANQFPQATILSGMSFKGKNMDFAILPQNISGNYSALVVSPDNFSLIACTLSSKPAIYFKNTKNTNGEIKITAYSEFSSASTTMNVSNQKKKKITNKVWIVFVVLAIVVALFALMVLIQIGLNRCTQGSNKEELIETN